MGDRNRRQVGLAEFLPDGIAASLAIQCAVGWGNPRGLRKRIVAVSGKGDAVVVACSTLCFARYPLEEALRIIAELQFAKVDVAIQSQGAHLTPEEVVADVHRVARRLKLSSSLLPAAIRLDINEPDAAKFDLQFRAVCKLARLLTVATLAIPAAPSGSDVDAEVNRLTGLCQYATSEGLVLTVETWIGTLTELPDMAVRLCERVPGLGLTLDPSHYVCGPHQNKPYDQVFPYVRHVHLRDTGRTPDKLQVRVGQGEIEYSKIVSQLERYRYDRLLSVDLIDQPGQAFSMETEVRKLKYLLESLA